MKSGFTSQFVDLFFEHTVRRLKHRYILILMILARFISAIAAGVGYYYVWISISHSRSYLWIMLAITGVFVIIETFIVIRFSLRKSQAILTFLAGNTKQAEQSEDKKLFNTAWTEAIEFPERVFIFETKAALLLIGLPILAVAMYFSNLNPDDIFNYLTGFLIALIVGMIHLWFFYERMMIPVLSRLARFDKKLLIKPVVPPRFSINSRMTFIAVVITVIPILFLWTLAYKTVFSILLIGGAGTDAETILSDFQKNFVIVGFLSVGLSIVIARLSVSSFARSLNSIIAELQQINTGDLTQTVLINARDELGQLSVAFNQLIASIGYLVEEIQDAGALIISSSFNVLRVSKEQERDSSHQAASINEISSTAQQLAASFKQIVDQAKNGEQMAGDTLHQAQMGQQLIDKNVEAFRQIRTHSRETIGLSQQFIEQSRKINQIFEVIQSIVAQTKMIALNASIEAASAGSAGRRFSVIATEVRTLADESTELLSEIARTVRVLQDSTSAMAASIQTEIQTIEDGVEHAEHIQQVFDEILGMAEKNAGAVKNIASVAAQQRSAQEQVVSSIQQIAEVADKMASASKTLNDLTVQMDDLARKLSLSVQNYQT